METIEKTEESKEEIISTNEYIYIVREREFIDKNEETYKIGKTAQPHAIRTCDYPKGSELIMSCRVNNCTESENEIIKLFKEKIHS